MRNFYRQTMASFVVIHWNGKCMIDRFSFTKMTASYWYSIHKRMEDTLWRKSFYFKTRRLIMSIRTMQVYYTKGLNLRSQIIYHSELFIWFMLVIFHEWDSISHTNTLPDDEDWKRHFHLGPIVKRTWSHHSQE